MSALTATLVAVLDASAGTKKIKQFTVTPEADGDTVALGTWFSSIDATQVELLSGLDANLALITGSHSGTALTIVEKKPDGTTSASDWTGASILITVTGEDSAL